MKLKSPRDLPVDGCAYRKVFVHGPSAPNGVMKPEVFSISRDDGSDLLDVVFDDIGHFVLKVKLELT